MVVMLQVLNYGQSVFEGMKAQRSAKGRVVLFRPEENAARLQAGACFWTLLRLWPCISMTDERAGCHRSPSLCAWDSITCRHSGNTLQKGCPAAGKMLACRA